MPAPAADAARHVDRQHVFVVGHAGAVREAVQVAEPAAEGDLIVGAEFLFGEDEDDVVQERLAHALEGVVAQFAQVDGDFRADQACQRGHGERHGGSLSCRARDFSATPPRRHGRMYD